MKNLKITLKLMGKKMTSIPMTNANHCQYFAVFPSSLFSYA